MGLTVIALLSPILANDMPLYVKYNGGHYFPAFTWKNQYQIIDQEGNVETIQLDIAKWKRMELENVIWAPVAYAPGKSEKNNRYLNADYTAPGDAQQFLTSEKKVIAMPLKFRHWLGTGKKGEDILSGLIHGTKISLLIGIVSMGIATVIGLLLGSLSGYFGDHKLTTTRGSFWVFVFGIAVAFYYGFLVRSFNLSDGLVNSGFSFLWQLFISVAVFAAIATAFYFLGKLAGRLPLLGKKVNVPVDSMVLRCIEILISIPRLILIISIAAIVSKPSIVNIMVIIGLTSWTGIARFTRAEFLRIRELDYIQAARALGYSQRRIIFRHALPNSLAPALVAIAFGVATAILIESGLSFLGIGVPHDVVTWGSLLSEGRQHFSAWWLVVFPGLAIFITVTVYNLMGEGLRDALDPRLKQ